MPRAAVRYGFEFWAMILVLTALTIPAGAAVRRCHATVSSEIAAAPVERDAKKKALDQWRLKAQGFGAGFDSWRLAYTKALTCSKKDAGFECVAIGAPCIVDQTPASPVTLPAKKVPSI